MEQKPSVNFVIFYESIFQCSPWRNSIRLWTERGYDVNVYQIWDYRNHKYKANFSDNFRLVEVKIPYFLKLLLAIIKRIFRVFRYFNLKGLSGFGDAIDLLCRSLIFVSTVYLKTNKKKRHVFIAGDPVSLAAVYLLQRRTNNVLIYWSLELWIEKDLQNFGQILVKKIERYCNKFSLYTIEFGQSRCNLLSVENKIPLSSMLSIPNSPLGAAEIKRNYYFNEMFNIEKDKKIVLHAGGYGEAYCINSLINQIAAWPSDCVLVIHTKAEMKLSNNDMLYQLLKRRKNVFLSNEPVPFERLDDIYSSCDIGLVFFDGTHTAMNTNLSCPDLSSGKMFHYLKFGVPIITQKLMGFEELIEGNEVGICIDKFDDITESITKILSHENGYKQNCIKMFRKYIFKEYHDKIVRLIEEAI